MKYSSMPFQKQPVMSVLSKTLWHHWNASESSVYFPRNKQRVMPDWEPTLWTTQELLVTFRFTHCHALPCSHQYDSYFTSGLWRRLTKCTFQRWATAIIIIIQIRRAFDSLLENGEALHKTISTHFTGCTNQAAAIGSEVWDSKNIFPKATTTRKQTAKRNTTLLHGG